MNQNVLSFLSKVKQDSALSNSLIGIELDQLVSLAAKNGFQFSGDDWMSTLTELNVSELSDSQLDNVSGGGLPLIRPSTELAPGVINATGVPPFAPGLPSK
jgi:predicted ribosomally synthesized peptide with nif11-like leader